MENKTKEELLALVEKSIQQSFELGMKYAKLTVGGNLLPILRELEINEEEIKKIFDALELLQEDTFADIFDN